MPKIHPNALNGILNANIASNAQIDWAKLNKAGSSLADLTTKSFDQLTGTLPEAALPSSVARKNAATALTAQSYFTEATINDPATGTLSWDVAAAQVAKVTLAANRIMAAPTNLQAGAFYSLMVIQDNSGSKTISWNSVFKWAAGTAPTLSTAASARDIFVFRSDGTNLYEVGRALGVA